MRKKKNAKAQKSINRRKNIFKEIFSVNEKFEFIGLLKNIIMPVAGCFIIGFITKNSLNTYDALKKSMITPPNLIFRIVWITLYTLMGIAAYRIYMNNKQGKNDHGGYFNYLVQLLISFFWAIIFLNLRLYGISFILICILLLFIVITTVKFLKTDRIAAVLMIPYILWTVFAGYLSIYIWIFNEM